MRGFRPKSVLRFVAFGLIFIANANADGRKETCFHLDETAFEDIEQSPYKLCMASSDLNRYPRSVVTFSLRKSVSLSDYGPNETDKASGVNRYLASDDPKVLIRTVARRHYVRLAPNTFGRRNGKPQVVFHGENNTVYLGFFKKEGSTFFFKPIEALKESVPLQVETQESDTLASP